MHVVFDWVWRRESAVVGGVVDFRLNHLIPHGVLLYTSRSI